MVNEFKDFDSEKVIQYSFSQSEITNGILHIGIGNFHRAHQQFYNNKLLEYPDQQTWGTCGVALLPSDEKLVKVLQHQKGNYSLTICGHDDKTEAHAIGSITEVVWGIEDPKKVISEIANPKIKILTLTITEGGYLIDGSNNEFMIDDANVQHDLKNPKNPKTIFGFVAEGLRERMDNSRLGLTILSCDNLQHNGDTTKIAFHSFIEAQDKALYKWIKKNVSFPNSMVDRITPSTTKKDIDWLNSINNINDQAPVFCEDFSQWVIEDNFIAGRPSWERVGVEFTEDVSEYENMKLSLLNASHTLLSYPAFLIGYKKVDKAMQDQLLYNLLEDFMNIDITPYVPAPKNIDLDSYKQTLLKRFSNPSVSDQISRLCFDGMSKFPVYILPNLSKMIKDKKDVTRLAFLIASYRHYLKYKENDKKENFTIKEPWLDEKDYRFIENDDVFEFLKFKPFEGINLIKSQDFCDKYKDFCDKIKNQGTRITLESIIK